MNEMNTEYLERCIGTLEKAFKALRNVSADDEFYDIYRAACVKEFEIILEQTGKLLKKCLKPYFATVKQVDQLNVKDIFRYAAKYGLLEAEEAERWLRYRDSQYDKESDDCAEFPEEIFRLLPQFIADAKLMNGEGGKL